MDVEGGNYIIIIKCFQFFACVDSVTHTMRIRDITISEPKSCNG